MIFSNIFILGQDLAFFMGFEDGNLIFKTNYSDSNPIIYTGLISQIIWTISLEILFYLIAPFYLEGFKDYVCCIISFHIFKGFVNL